MAVKLTITKIADISAGLLKDDTHIPPETFTVDVPAEYVIDYTPGEVLQEPGPQEYYYTLIKSSDGIEKIIFSSEGEIPNPWKGSNLLITIPGKTNEIVVDSTLNSQQTPVQQTTIDPVSGWNYNTWNVEAPVTIGDYTVTDVKITALSPASDTRYLVRAKITIINNDTGVVFGPNFVVSRSGYLLLSRGLSHDGPQEVDLINGSEVLDAAVILHKIETV